MTEDFAETFHHRTDSERATQTLREPIARDFDNFSKLDWLIHDSHNRLGLRYAWDTIQEDRNKRRGNFESLDETDKEIAQAALKSALETNNSHLIPAMFFLGRETDLSLVDEVPEDQRTNMEIAVRFCRANELSLQASGLVSKDEDKPISQADYNRLLSICGDLIEELHELQKFDVVATHSTDAKSREGIEESGELWGAARPNLYLGEGVYAGVFGSYLEWNAVDESGKNKAIEDNNYRFTVPLSECTLLINNPLAPRPMVNIQYGSVDAKSINTISRQIETGVIPQAQVIGNPYYERDPGRQLNRQGAQLFRRLAKDLDLDISFIGDAKTKDKIRESRGSEGEGQKHLVIDTNEPPLVWVTLADISGLERMTVVEDVDEKFEDVAA